MTRPPRIWPHLVAAALVVASLAWTFPAHAQDGSAPKDLQIGIGLKGGPTGMGATEVPEDCPCLGPEGNGDPELYGMFGAGYGFGLALDGRYDRTVGLETGFYYADDSVDGTNDIQDTAGNRLGSITQSQTTTAYHIPLLVKASPPFDNVRPVFGLGLEFVLQQSSELEYSADGISEADVRQRQQHNTIKTSNYTLLQFTAGLEIDAGPVRIPIAIRTGYNLGWKDSIDERLDFENRNGADEQIIYDGEYLGHFGLYAGVLYRWDIAM